MWEEPDLLSSTGARSLAKQIQDFWHKRGRIDVNVWIEPLRIDKDGIPSIYFQVRSDISRKLLTPCLC